MHQFGSMVLAVDAYRQQLLAGAAQVRPIPITHRAKDLVPIPFAQSRRAIGTMLLRVGRRLQAVHPIGHDGRGPGAALESGRTF